MKIMTIFHKQGGMGLIKQYWQGGALSTAIAEFLILGKEKTALEILRLAASFKIYKKLKRKYYNYLLEFDRDWQEKEHKRNNVVWICWFQGLENAPDIVKRCVGSIQANLKGKEIILIDNNNIYNYVSFPESIQQKIDKGIINGAHFSDLIRLELLIRYGGTWIDSTVFCSGENIPDYMFDSDLFMYQLLKPGKDGQTAVISNWFISSHSGNKMLSALRHLLFAYWENNDEIVDYYIFHDFFQMVIEFYPEEWNKVIPVSSSTPHILLLRLFEKYDKRIWDSLKTQTCFHKLSYKIEEESLSISDTFYKKLLSQDLEGDV